MRFSFFCLMDVIGTLSLVLEFSAVKQAMQGNSLTSNSVVMRATRASKLGARAGRLTRLVKLRPGPARLFGASQCG